MFKKLKQGIILTKRNYSAFLSPYNLKHQVNIQEVLFNF